MDVRFAVIDRDVRRKADIVMQLATANVYCAPFADVADFHAGGGACDCLLLCDAPDQPAAAGLAALNAGPRSELVIVYGADGDVAAASQAVRLGAIDYRPWPFEPQALIAWLDSNRGQFLPLAALRRRALAARQRLAALTPREADVLHAMADGRSNKQIAVDFALSHRTVEAHRLNLLRRIAATSSSEAVRLSIESRLFDG